MGLCPWLRTTERLLRCDFLGVVSDDDMSDSLGRELVRLSYSVVDKDCTSEAELVQ